jgi:hypothetical protein
LSSSSKNLYDKDVIMKATITLVSTATGVLLSAAVLAQGSGPDASKSNIVSPQEQQKQIDAKRTQHGAPMAGVSDKDSTPNPNPEEKPSAWEKAQGQAPGGGNQGKGADLQKQHGLKKDKNGAGSNAGSATGGAGGDGQGSGAGGS